ncbi:hypothetical protein M2M59_13155 [Rummeliibacillus sp. G93]|uniref:hypothetical protein n=1 Tax=Rummeliibacillus TaxID=648802 RepID=UPI001167C0E0|nr:MULTISPECIES: hypothetical protein [Rummeliibacillus]MBB5170823.1 hypothetical protein [Rummeliibacillus stabekisii]UQW96875.1 hypothetical protein M2M59_13155 [Rummeliibacillus sp. G93]GEL05919.1 hypothetical protein RST01_25460 [Rummeliibacillus stabekisii]
MKKIALAGVATAMLLSSVAATEATPVSAATTTVQLNKKGVLVNKATGKIVKGYKVFNGDLYKNGSLARGRVKYGSGKNLKLYRNGHLQKGYYITRDFKYFFRNGKLVPGKTLEDSNLNDCYYQDGVLTKRIYVKSDGKLYENTTLKKGDYVIRDLDDDYEDVERMTLYTNGILSKGYHFADYKKITYLFKDGRIQQASLYKGKLYKNGKPAPKNEVISDGKDTYYYNDALADGVINDYLYENGKKLYNATVKNYLDKLAEIKKLSIALTIDSKVLNTKLAEFLAYYTEHYYAIYQNYLVCDDEDCSEEPAYKILTAQFNDLKEIVGKLDHTDATMANDKAIREKLDYLYDKQSIHSANGEILNGEYKGNIYTNGRLIGSREDVALSAATSTYKGLSTDESATMQQKVDALTSQVKAANDVFTSAKAPEYPYTSFNTREAEEVLRESLIQRRALIKKAVQQQVSVNTAALEEELLAGFAELDEKITFNQPSTTATYKPLAVDEVATGTFDDDGYAYFAITIDQVEGNYYLTGNADVPELSSWISNAKETINGADEAVGKKLRYLEKGVYYMAVQGKPNASYRFKLYQRTYNYTTMAELLSGPNALRTPRVKLPYYQYSTPSIDINLTTDEHIMLYAVSNEDSFKKTIENIVLTNKATGKTYPVVRISTTFFSSNAPNGKYSLSVTPTKKGVPGHVGIRYETSPHLKINEPNKGSYFYTLNVKKDTKFKFMLTSKYGQAYSDEKMRLYDHNHHLVKAVTLAEGTKQREFVYTVKKGRYSITGEMIITATLK